MMLRGIASSLSRSLTSLAPIVGFSCRRHNEFALRVGRNGEGSGVGSEVENLPFETEGLILKSRLYGVSSESFRQESFRCLTLTGRLGYSLDQNSAGCEFKINLNRLSRERIVDRIARWMLAAGVTLLIGLPSQAQKSHSESEHPASGVTFLEWPLAPEDHEYAAIDGKHLEQYVTDQIAFSDHYRDEGHQLWGRITGTSADVANQQWLLEWFKQAGPSDVPCASTRPSTAVAANILECER